MRESERNSSRVSWRVSERDTYNWFGREDVSSKRNSTMRKTSPCVEQIHTITSLIHIERLDYTVRTFAMLRGRHGCYRGMRRTGCWLSSKGHPRIYNTAKNTREKRQSTDERRRDVYTNSLLLESSMMNHLSSLFRQGEYLENEFTWQMTYNGMINRASACWQRKKLLFA